MSRASWRFAAELHAQVGAVEPGALEVGAGKDCTPEVCAGELCALEVDSGEVERSKAVGGKLAAPKHRHRSLHVSGRALWLRRLIVRFALLSLPGDVSGRPPLQYPTLLVRQGHQPLGDCLQGRGDGGGREAWPRT